MKQEVATPEWGGALTNNICRLLFQFKLKPGFRFCSHNDEQQGGPAQRAPCVWLGCPQVLPFSVSWVSPVHPLCAPHLNWCMLPYISEQAGKNGVYTSVIAAITVISRLLLCNRQKSPGAQMGAPATANRRNESSLTGWGSFLSSTLYIPWDGQLREYLQFCVQLPDKNSHKETQCPR